MISPDVKPNKKQQEINGLVAVSRKIFLGCKKGEFFSFDFGWYFIHLDIYCPFKHDESYLNCRQTLISILDSAI